MTSGRASGAINPEDALHAVNREERIVRSICLLYGCQCNACCERIERALRRIKGVRHVEVNLYKATATVDHDESCPPVRLIEAIERIGFLATFPERSS